MCFRFGSSFVCMTKWKRARRREEREERGGVQGACRHAQARERQRAKLEEWRLWRTIIFPLPTHWLLGPPVSELRFMGYAIRADYEADLISGALLHLSQWLNTGSPCFSCCGSLCACSRHGPLIKCLQSWTGGKRSSFNYGMRRVEWEREWCCVVLHCGQCTPGTSDIIGKYCWNNTPGLAWVHA